MTNNSIDNKRTAKIMFSAMTDRYCGTCWLDGYNQQIYKSIAPCIRIGLNFRNMDHLLFIYEI